MFYTKSTLLLFITIIFAITKNQNNELTKTKNLLLVCMFSISLISFVGCSNNEKEDVQTEPKTETAQKQSSEFTNAFVSAIEQADSEPVYLVFDNATKESQICNEEQFVLGQCLYMLVNAGNHKIIKKTYEANINE